MMDVIRDLAELGRPAAPVVALGNFDGVHIGHQVILRNAIERARQLHGTAFALTFDPLPAKVLAPDRAPKQILTAEDKATLLRASGIDGVIILPFTLELSRLTPREFVRECLCRQIGVRAVVIGHNVSFGHQRAGNARVMEELGRELGFEAIVVGPVKAGDLEVSSTSVREAINAGDMRKAAQMLGRPHFLSGPVVHGRERGRTIGFPTANLAPRTECIPPDGVYATRLRLPDGAFASITNIGMRPTFAEPARTFEAHVFDFDLDIYDQEVKLDLVERIRPERKFGSPQELAAQIASDVQRAKSILAAANA
jgi:riboflavin kinase/FMN adenylyltransferase